MKTIAAPSALANAGLFRPILIKAPRASVLNAVGLSDWIATDAEDYVRRAARFAGESEVLAELRSSLRSRMRASPLMDEECFTHDLERAYRQMWGKWCQADVI